LNRKIVKRIIGSDKESFASCDLKEADDGESALEVVRVEREATGVEFDFILIDYIMVTTIVNTSGFLIQLIN
jgi:hypothetical protein